jgi:diguanylate cyclase (GGDEF)-like protein
VETADAVRVAVLGRRDSRVMVLAGPTDAPSHELSQDPVLEQAWTRREPVLLARIDAETDPGLAAALPDARNVAILPMIADGQPVGALAVEFGTRIGPRVERRVVTMASQFAAHAALALQNAWLLEALGRLASADPLTGLANRRAFNGELDRALARAGRRGEPVALVLLDVDHFKSVNDTWGHQIGDEVLRDVAKALTTTVRPEATVARHGGEEFAVLLPECGTGDALLIAERLRGAVGRLTVRETSPITISVGVAVLGPSITTAAQLLDGADRALYAAKRAGRNRVRCADELPPSSASVPDSRSPRNEIRSA